MIARTLRGAALAAEAAAYAAASAQRTGIEGFADEEIEKAVFYPEDDQFLIERDLVARRHDVAAPGNRRPGD